MSKEFMTGYDMWNSDTELGNASRNAFPTKVQSVKIEIEPDELVKVTVVSILPENIMEAKTWKLLLENKEEIKE